MDKIKNILRREFVEKRLREGAAYPLTFVCAPLGYGKTTVVRAFVRSRGVRSLWIAGVPDDEALFWKRLCGVFAHSHPAWGAAFNGQCFPLADVQIAQFIDTLKKALTAPCVLVIDDYHCLDAQSPLQQLLFMLALEQVPLLRVICVGRHAPRHMVAELLAKDLCALISAEHLAFSRAEVAAYLVLRRVADPEAAPGLAETIFNASEGWASAVFLMSEGVRRGQDVCSLANTYHLFERAVFDTLDRASRLLLVELSLFDEFTLPEAAFVLESTGVQPLVRGLDARNTFIIHNVTTGTYRLHSLFRQFLAYKADLFDFDIRHIHHRMGLWHLNNGDIPTAFRYYHKAGRLEELFATLTPEDRLHLRPEACDLYRSILQALDPDIPLRYPLVVLYLSLLLLLSGQQEDMRCGRLMLQRLRRHFIRERASHPQRERVVCELHLVSSVARFNDPYLLFGRASCGAARVMAEILRPMAPFASFTLGLPALLFLYYREPGDMDRVVDFLIARFDPDKFEGLGYGFDKLLRAEAHLERCETEKTRLYAEQALLQSPLKNQFYITACAHFVLMRLAVFEGDLSEAFARLDAIRLDIPARGQHFFTPTAARIYATFCELCETYLLSLVKNVKQLKVRQHGPNRFGQLFIFRGLGVIELGTVKFKILDGNYVEADILADYYEREFAVYRTQLGRLRYLIFRAIIRHNLDETAHAVRTLREALVEAARDGLVLVFAENADFIMPLLREMTPDHELPPDFLHTVREKCRFASQNLKNRAACAGSDLLTSREVEVFHLLAQGQSQKSMAMELGISISTVKRHLESMYAKFGVNNRVAAMNKGLALGL